jgi:hypothetical protein
VFVIARRVTQRTIAGLALALALPVLTGCGLEAMDETSKEHAQVQAADHRIGAVRIRNAFLTTIPGAGGGTTYLVVTLVNNSKTPDTFTGITTSIGTGELSDGPVTLPPGVVVQVSDPQINPTASTLVVSGESTTVGTTVDVQFTFGAAGTTPSIPVPVVEPGLTLTPKQVVPTNQEIPPTPIV